MADCKVRFALLFALIVLSMSSAHRAKDAKRKKRAIGAVGATLIAGAIGAAGSTAGTGMQAAINHFMADTPDITCIFEIDNYTKWPMRKPIIYPHSGAVKNPPSPVFPGKTETFIVHKDYNKAAGTYGTVSWKLRSFRIMVMWSAPYNFVNQFNRLAVGITYESHTKYLFDKMYTGAGRFSTKADYYSEAKTISYCNEQVCVHGIMGTTHKIAIYVWVFPKSYDDLATSVKQIISEQDWTTWVRSVFDDI